MIAVTVSEINNYEIQKSYKNSIYIRSNNTVLLNECEKISNVFSKNMSNFKSSICNG